MSARIRVVAFLLLSSLLALSLPFSAVAENENLSSSPSVSAEAAVLVEAESGKIIFGKEERLSLPMASTTKIMTAFVVLKHKTDLSEKVVIPPKACGIEGSSVYLVAGETLSVEELLYALLLASANDAAVALAIATAGSVDAFADLMNASAVELGLSDSHFCNPNGLDDEEHYTSARDLAVLTVEAMKNEVFRKIVSTKKAIIPHIEYAGGRVLTNHNKLLRLYPDAIGVKTGFTKRSGRCLVSAANRDGVELVCVTLNAPDDWNDHCRLFDYGFSRYERVSLLSEREISYSLPVVGGELCETLLTNVGDASVTLPVGHGEIRMVTESERFLYAPVEADTVKGYAVFFCDTDADGMEEEIARVPLSVQMGVSELQKKKSFWEWLFGLFRR